MVEVTAGFSTPSAGLDGPGPVRDPRRPFARSPFSRLARTHALGIAGDAFFAIALAGSVFFSLDFNEARWKVALYLLLTIAPFAVAAPLIGPALDRIRGGRRWVIVGSMALRALLCFLVIRHLDSLLFYPEAFLMLVLGKTYTISKSAVVPTTVRNDRELVEANSKLTVISAVAVVVAAVPAGLLLKLGGPRWTLALAVVVFAAAAAMAFQLPATAVATEPAGEAERMELRSAAIFLASTAMGMIRGVVGFLAFMLAFAFKDADAGLWQLGVVAAAAQLGFFLGAVAAPWLRRHADEERILLGSLAVISVVGVVCFGLGGLVGAALLSLSVGMTSSAAKQAFDAIVQRDAPDANRGRSFARFETRFQLFWVIGALVPIVIPLPATLGFLAVAVAAGSAGVNYAIGLRHVRQGRLAPRRAGLRRGSRGRPGPASKPPPESRVEPPAPGLTAPAGAVPEPPSAAFTARRWARPSEQREQHEQAATVTVDERGSAVFQPPLPLDETVVDETLDYPEPPWRDSPAPE